jgi:predicted nucleic acid-binding protein
MLVLDANILIRAVLGTRVPWLLDKYAERGEFFAPDSAFREAREELPVILERRAMPVAPGLATLDAISKLLRVVEPETYAPMEALARQRLARRDEDDWPILAAALA